MGRARDQIDAYGAKGSCKSMPLEGEMVNKVETIVSTGDAAFAGPRYLFSGDPELATSPQHRRASPHRCNNLLVHHAARAGTFLALRFQHRTPQSVPIFHVKIAEES